MGWQFIPFLEEWKMQVTAVPCPYEWKSELPCKASCMHNIKCEIRSFELVVFKIFSDGNWIRLYFGFIPLY